jgi:hypothetical protein
MRTTMIPGEQEQGRLCKQSTGTALHLKQIVVGVDCDDSTDMVVKTASSVAERFQ